MNRCRDSYLHYRQDVGLGRLRSVFRALYYEVTGRDWIRPR